jgi:competence protein ComEC
MAVLLCATAAIGPLLPLRWLLAALAIGAAWRPGVAVWLPFLLAGWFAGRRAEPPPPLQPDAARLIASEGTIVRPSRQAFDRPDQQRSQLRLQSGGIVWLIEPSAAPPRCRADRISFVGWFQPLATSLGTLTVEQPSKVRDAGRGGSFLLRLLGRVDRANAAARQILEQRLGTDCGLAAALFLGRAEELGEADRNVLQATGCYHYLAISGFHVALLGWIALCGGRRLGLPRSPAMLTALGLVLGFAVWSGARPPVVRAAVVFAAWLWSHHRRRSMCTDSVLAFALLWSLGMEHGDLARPGLQLSFVAVVGIKIASLYRRATSPRGTGTGVQLHRPLVRLIAVSIGATLATAPLTAFHFETVSLLSPVSSLLLLPWILPLMATAATIVVAHAPLPALAEVLADLEIVLSRSLLTVARGLDHLPATPLEIPSPPLGCVFALLLGLVPLVRRRPLWALPCIGCSALLWSLSIRASGGDGILVLPTGHGQCVVVRSSGRTDVLDAGTKHPTSTARRRFETAIRRLRIERIDGLFLSHLDADHACFAPWLIERFGCDELLLSVAHKPAFHAVAPQASTLAALQRAALEGRTTVRFLRSGDRVGPHQVLWPRTPRHFSPNEGSLVLLSTLGGEVFLFPGDLEGPGLVELARQLTGPVDSLLLPHHGNADDHLAALLRRALPVRAIASRSAPLPEPVSALLGRLGIPCWTTARHGAIEVPARNAAHRPQPTGR